MVGPWPLTPVVEVRILSAQPISQTISGKSRHFVSSGNRLIDIRSKQRRFSLLFEITEL